MENSTLEQELKEVVRAMHEVGLTGKKNWRLRILEHADLGQPYTRGYLRFGLLRVAAIIRRRLLQPEIRPETKARYEVALSALIRALQHFAVLRLRKGRLVEVPHCWVGVTTTEQTKRARREEAKLKRKARRRQLRKDAAYDLRESLSIGSLEET